MGISHMINDCYQTLEDFGNLRVVCSARLMQRLCAICRWLKHSTWCEADIWDEKTHHT